MIGWQKFYNKNYAIGIIGSIIIHLLLVLLMLIPIKEEDPNSYIYFENTPAQITIQRFDKVSLLEIDLGGGSSSGIDNGLNPKSSSTKEYGNLVASSSANNIDFGVDSFKGKDSVLSGSGSGVGNGHGKGIGAGTGDGIGSGKGTGKVYSSLPFVPRQTLEVLPEKSDCGEGIIILALHVGKDGAVKEHKVMMNSFGARNCLEKVIEAAYKSRWQSVKMEGDIVEYWVEKTYSFN